MRPPSHGYDRELLSGLFVLLGIFVVGLFSLKITDSPIFRPGTEYTVILTDANGIYKSSKVKIAGINVGIVREVELKDAKAKIKILLDRGYRIEKGAYVLPKSQGILGDRFLEIVLPQNDQDKVKLEQEGTQYSEPAMGEGSSTSFLNWILPMAAADEIYQSGDTIPTKPGSATADDVMRKLGEIGDDVKVLAKDLKEIVHDNKGNIDSAIKSIRKSADHLELILGDLAEKSTRTDLKEAIHGMHEAVENIRTITDRMNKGEGTIGKLINDPQIADQLVRALNSINEYLERAKRTEIIVDMNTNFLTGVHKNKTFLNLTILPRSSYGYRIGIVQDPGGRITKTERSVSVNGAPPTRYEEEDTDKSAFKFDLQFIRKIYSTTFRLGLFETTGGIGIDQDIWKDHISVTGEAYDFGRDNENAHVRVFAKVQFLDAFYLQAGVDELAAKFNKNRTNSTFIGVGIRFTDDDIKNLLVLLGPG